MQTAQQTIESSMLETNSNALKILARPERFERPTLRFVVLGRLLILLRFILNRSPKQGQRINGLRPFRKLNLGLSRLALEAGR